MGKRVVEGTRFSLSRSFKGRPARGRRNVADEGRGEDLLDLSRRRIKTRCACHETSPLPESQLNRSTVPKRDSHSRPAPTSLFLSSTLFASPFSIPLTFNPSRANLNRAVLSADPIRHASRLMSSLNRGKVG